MSIYRYAINPNKPAATVKKVPDGLDKTPAPLLEVLLDELPEAVAEEPDPVLLVAVETACALTPVLLVHWSLERSVAFEVKIISAH